MFYIVKYDLHKADTTIKIAHFIIIIIVPRIRSEESVCHFYSPVRFCTCCCNGNWKSGNASPVPSAYGICPFHLLTDCHCRYCGLCLNCSVIMVMACASPDALATFAFAWACAPHRYHDYFHNRFIHCLVPLPPSYH